MSLGPASPARAITLKLSSVFLFVVMASLIKAASDEVPPGEAVFFRSAFAIPVIVGWLAARGELTTGFRTVDPLGHVWRGFVGTMAQGCFFAGLAVLPLYEVKAIQYAMPLFVVILAAFLLGERIRIIRISAVALGMAGVLMILWPRLTAFGLSEFDPRLAAGALIVLVGSFCGATAQIFIRKLVRTETTSAIVFWFSVTATVLSALTAPFGWVWPSATVAAFLILAGLIGGAGQILLTSAYRYADAGIVAPFEYASMLFAVAIGWAVFAEVPTPEMLAGAALVVAGGLAILVRERQLAIRRDKARRAMSHLG